MKYAAIGLVNRNYGRIEAALLTHHPLLITGLFFRLLSQMNRLLTHRTPTPLERLGNMLCTTQDMVRGHGPSPKDWGPEDGDDIHLILKKAST